MTPRKLAIVSSRFPRGTAEPYLADEIRALEGRGFEVVVFPVRAAGAACHARTALAAVRAFARAPLGVLRAFASVLGGPARPSVRVKNAIVFPRALAIAEGVRAAGAEHVHAYWLSTPATAAMVAARLCGVPWSASAHRWDIFEDNLIERKAASARFIRTISDRGRDELLRRSGGNGERVHVVRLGTALAREPRAVSSARGPLLCAAAFVPVKGHDALLRAFAAARLREPAISLVLAGAGPLRAATERRARLLGLEDAVTFAGYLPREELLDGLARGRYGGVVLASGERGSEMEGVPSILIEAMSLGVPCVATLSGGVKELLDENCGFTVEPGDVEGLARALLRWYREPEEARRRAAAGRARAWALHAPERAAEGLCSLFAAASADGA